MRLTLWVCVLATFLCVVPSSASATHGRTQDCTDFSNQSEAQNYVATHPGERERLGGDMNGRPCEGLPCPCGATVGTTTAPQVPPPVLPPVSAAPLAEARSAFRGRVLRVIGGESLRVRLTTGRTVTVRLIGVDTPSLRRCGGREATGWMRRLALRNGRGRVVTLTTDPDQDETDRVGRLLAYVSSAGRDFGRTLISAGWAKALGRDFERASRYRSTQSAARSARRGLWRHCGGSLNRAR